MFATFDAPRDGRLWEPMIFCPRETWVTLAGPIHGECVAILRLSQHTIGDRWQWEKSDPSYPMCR